MRFVQSIQRLEEPGMRILALADRTELGSQSGQVHNINPFWGMEVDLCCDMSSHQVEQMLTSKDYDSVFPSVSTCASPICSSDCSTLWDVLRYHGQDYIGSCADDLMLFRDKALSEWRSGMGLPSLIITRPFWNRKKDEALKRLGGLTFPVVLESNLTSAPLSRLSVQSEAEAIGAVDLLFRHHSNLTEILTRKYPDSYEQYAVFVLGNGNSLVCWSTAVLYAAGQRTSLSAYPMESAGSFGLTERLEDCARTLAHIFSVRDYCQFDFIVDASQRIYFTGINATPSLSKISECTCAGALRFHPEQLFALLLLVFFRGRDAVCPTPCFIRFPKRF